MLRRLKRAARELLPEAFRQRSFDAASGRRGGPSFGTFSTETLAAAPTVRARARQVYANHAYVHRAVEELVSAAVGAGIMPTVPGRLDAQYTPWAKRADADGRTDFYGLQANVLRSVVVDGEAFVLTRLTDAGLRLQLIPAEMVADDLTEELGDGRYIVGGVEFSAQGDRIAYHVRQQRPTDLFNTYAPPVRVPADQVLHVFRPLGPGQVRGISWLAPVLLTANEFDQLTDALLVNAKIQAMHVGFLVDQSGMAQDSPYANGSKGDPLEVSLEPGTMKYLPPGWDVRWSSPQQAQQAVDFARLTLESIAAGIGVPYHRMTGDLRQANYSSLRSAEVGFRQRIEQIQFHVLVPQFLQPVWLRFIAYAVLFGDAPLGDNMAVEWIPPAMPWVDPAKDAEATTGLIAAGLMSRRQAVAAQGYSVEKLDAEIAADRTREKALGLDFSSKPAQEPKQNAV